ncbi:MAG: alpha/beta hydrolase [Mariniphaga sp.]|nr:alpha/beta hydrolase [Mariniphaga sp.]
MNKAILKSEYGDIYYELSGEKEKPVVIFTHGVGMDHQTFKMQVEAIKSDYSVLVWDLPGHGRSTIKEQNERFTKMSACCLNKLMNETGVSKAILVGQSLGSMIVQHFLIKYHEKVTATVHVPGIELKRHIGSWSKMFVPLMMGMFYLFPKNTFYRMFGRHRAENTEVQNYLSDSMRQTGKKLALKITKDMVYDLIDKHPAQEKRPLLITYGEKELLYIQKASRKWHELSLNSKCVRIKNANHILNQDNPEEFNRAFIDFLEEIKKEKKQ